MGPCLAGEQLGHGVIMKHADGVFENLGGEMEVSDFPGDKRCLGGRFQGEFIHGFRHLADDVILFRSLENDAAIGEAVFQIESELGAIRGKSAPAPFQELAALGSDHHLILGRAGGLGEQDSLNEMHRRRGMSSPHADVNGGRMER